MRYRFIGWCLVVLALVDTAAACIIRFQSPELLKRDAAVVVDAVVTSIGQSTTSFHRRSYGYHVRVERILRGHAPGSELLVTYDDLLPHQRGAETVCPLKFGSGIEHQLAVGARYRFYLRAEKDPTILIVTSGEAETPL